MKRSYRNFRDDFLALKEQHPELSYGKLARMLKWSDSYMYNLVNRYRASFIPKKKMAEIAKIFHVAPEYFFEYRLQNLIEDIQREPESLDYAQKAVNRFQSDNKLVKRETIEFDDGADEPDADGERKITA